MHTHKPKTSHSNNSVIYIGILLRFYHLPVTPFILWQKLL